MTKPNSSGFINQTPKKSTWPVWFPYPSSWLKAIILALFLGVISFVFINTGQLGYKIAYLSNSPELSRWAEKFITMSWRMQQRGIKQSQRFQVICILLYSYVYLSLPTYLVYLLS